MRIKSEYRDGVLRLQLRGELDHHAASAVMREIESALDRYMPVDCALDLSGLKFMDSSGIAVILRVHKRMRSQGGRVIVVDPAEQPLRVLDASGIDRLVRIASTAKERSR